MAITIELSPELELKARQTARINGIPLQKVIERALEGIDDTHVSQAQNHALLDSDSKAPTLWELRCKELQAMWDSQPGGAQTNYAELEEACDFLEERRSC